MASVSQAKQPVAPELSADYEVGLRRFRRPGHRSRPHPDPHDQDPGHQHLGEPARNTGVALWVGGEAEGQLWLFWLAPIAGALLAGWVGSPFAVSADLGKGFQEHLGRQGAEPQELG